MSGGPDLRGYLSRIGARKKNFRRHVIEDEDPSAYMGGRREIARITIESDGTIVCDTKEYAPTAEEQRAIYEEIAKAPFPKSVKARIGSLPPQLMGINPKDYFLFCDQCERDHITFIQWRKNDPKRDLPLSFWNDGEWREMEPDGLLPLWGLEQLNSFHTFLLHEGAKGARDVKAMVDEGGPTLAAHPWAAQIEWSRPSRLARRCYEP